MDDQDHHDLRGDERLADLIEKLLGHWKNRNSRAAKVIEPHWPPKSAATGDLVGLHNAVQEVLRMTDELTGEEEAELSEALLILQQDAETG